MFSIGNKIIVSESSIKKNKIGPKKGSIGYIKNIHSPVKYINQYFIANTTIIFYKFGYEKKYRTECKFISILLNDTDISNKQVLQQVNRNKLLIEKKIAILCKLDSLCTNIYTSDTSINERMAYLLSLWSNTNLYACLSDINKLGWDYKYKDTNIKIVLQILLSGLINNKYKHNFILEISNNIDNYKYFIEAIKLITLRY